MFQHRGKLFCLLVALVIILNVNPILAYKKVSTNESISYPEPKGKAAVLMDAGSGRILYDENSRERLPQASLTKIMTALLVIENGDLNKDIQISTNATKTPESGINLQPGETLTRQQLLYACMLHSANDAAMALAESVSGNEQAFVKLMNERAKQLGMQDTHFCNPHGLENKNHYSSAYDLALLTRQAMSNPIFQQVVATRTTTIPWAGHPQDRTLVNENRLLYRYDGAIGVKTGYTKEAGNCVVGAAQRGNMILIAVSMDSPTVYDDLERMLDYGFTHYQMVTLEKSDQIAVPIKVLMGQVSTVIARPTSDLAVAATAAEVSQLTYKVIPRLQVFAPVKQGDPMGVCQIYLKGTKIGEVALLADSDVSIKASVGSIVGGSKLVWGSILSEWYIIGIVLVIAVLYKIKKKKAR
jgi:D-alanyl-D-alanine carboxypeptidase (penicillin-binding protein 5/6)